MGFCPGAVSLLGFLGLGSFSRTSGSERGDQQVALLSHSPSWTLLAQLTSSPVPVSIPTRAPLQRVGITAMWLTLVSPNSPSFVGHPLRESWVPVAAYLFPFPSRSPFCSGLGKLEWSHGFTNCTDVQRLLMAHLWCSHGIPRPLDSPFHLHLTHYHPFSSQAIPDTWPICHHHLVLILQHYS